MSKHKRRNVSKIDDPPKRQVTYVKFLRPVSPGGFPGGIEYWSRTNAQHLAKVDCRDAGGFIEMTWGNGARLKVPLTNVTEIKDEAV